MVRPWSILPYGPGLNVRSSDACGRRCSSLTIGTMHRIGDIIDDRYELTRPLGLRQGAEMWEAEHRVAGRKVTLKIVPGESGTDPLLRKRLASEARAAAEIGHPSVVEVYDVGVTHENEAYLVMELLRGETLADILAREGAMQAEDACLVIMQVLAALEAAHAATVVHGDLKAENVILRKGRNGDLIAKVLDFGVTEVAPSANGFDPRADIQGVGGLLYEMLSGRSTVRQGSTARVNGSVPAGDTAQALVPAIPAGLARIVDQALVPASGRRIASMKELVTLLSPFAHSDKPPSLAPRDTMMPFLSPEARRSRGMARLERAVLGITEPKKPSARPNLVLIEGDKAVPSSDPPTNRQLNVEELLEPRIPRPPRTPQHFGSSAPRPAAADRGDRTERGGRQRKRSLMPLRRWKAARMPASRSDLHAAMPAMSPLARRIWSAGLLAVAGLGAGLLLARLLHL